MNKKIRFEGREERLDGYINFIYFIEEDNNEQPGIEIKVIVDGQWYDEELMRIGKLDIRGARPIGVLIRYIALEAAEQFDSITSGGDDATYRTIPPDRAIDFNEIMNIARGEHPKVVLPEDFPEV